MNIRNLLCRGLTIAAVCSVLPASAVRAEEACRTEETYQSTSTETTIDSNGFVIKDGVLVNYIGDGGDIVIPNSVISIGFYGMAYINLYGTL